MAELKDKIVHLKSGLFPDVNVFLTLHKNISTNPHILTQRLSSITIDTDSGTRTSTNGTHDHFAIMDASRIASIDHLAIAVNSALLRTVNSASNSTNGNRTSPQMGQKRGRALDTIVCAGGSTNVGAVLKDFAFSESSTAAEEAKIEAETRSEYNVVLIGIGTTLEQYMDTMMNDHIALASSQHQPETIADMVAFFGRERSKEEVMQLIKIFKTTKEEVAMQGLEKAIINRVAAKFYI